MNSDFGKISRSRGRLTLTALLTLLMLAIWLPADSQVTPEADYVSSHPAQTASADDENLRVSIITCWPGKEIYELCGHAAIRIQGERFDSVWNYGMFNFNEPNFVYRFVKGETDYMLVGYPFAWFMPEYVADRRKVVEQVLDLSQEEAAKFRKLLQVESLPQNCRYRYNYVRDNCATRILDRLEQSTDRHPVYPDTVAYGSFRNAMRQYHAAYPWYQFGIDIALGSGIDRRINTREEMFAPVEMMSRLSETRFTDGRKLVKDTVVLNEGSPDAVLPPTPWWAAPMFWSIMVMLASICIVILDARRGRITKWWYSLFYFLLGVAGCVVTFLVCFSSHEATSPNSLWIWLNPLQLVAALCIWWRRTRIASLAVAWYDIVTTVVMLIVWPFQLQSANPAFFPLMASTAILSAGYAIISCKASYNNRNEQISHLSADKSGRTKHRDSGTRRKASPRGGNRR